MATKWQSSEGGNLINRKFANGLPRTLMPRPVHSPKPHALRELLVLAVLGSVVERVIELAKAESFRGKTVIDTTNPRSSSPPVPGVLSYFTGPNESLAERIQRIIPDAHVVKAFNSVGNARMVNPHYDRGTPWIFFCGNDTAVKSQVAEILRQFGWAPFDCGAVVAARAIEPLCML